MKKICYLTLLISAITTMAVSGQKSSEYVLIPGKIYYSSKDSFRLNDFEISDHAVTNIEYKEFIDASGYPCPLHWINGEIPAGKENYPVIYVNRDDVDAFLAWMNNNDDRNYRLPTAVEFKAAATENWRRPYYWGEDETILSSGSVNFDNEGTRSFKDWKKYLKPAQWGMRNEYGLYQMAGNIFHLVDDNKDPRELDYKFRIETLSSNERYIMGGSWASGKNELKLGRTFHQSPGIRYPDLGFRLVRDPKNSEKIRKYRNVAPVSHPSGAISISWAVLDSDPADIRFNIYRLTGNSRNHAGFKLNTEPIETSSFLDNTAVDSGTRYQYMVTGVNKKGEENSYSEWISITKDQYNYPVVVKFKAGSKDSKIIPVFGDLEGWGRKGCILKLENGNIPQQPDPGRPVQLEAFSSTGKSLWRKDIARHSGIYGNGTNAPFNVWDMDGDGKDEVISLYQIGEEVYVAILDGMSGKLLFKTPWDNMATDFSRASSRVHMSIANLDGKTPSVITMTGIYENEVISAYDNQLNKLWEYKSFRETSGSGSHKIEIADVDGDSKQEVIYGATCLNHDGSVRWSTYLGHPDIVSVADYLPENPGLEVCFIIETRRAGIYLADAGTGEIIWKNNRDDDPMWSHGHYGWTSDIWEGSPGIESISNRKGHGDRNVLLFTAGGEKIMEGFPYGYHPFEWDGDPIRELYADNGRIIGKFDGKEIRIIEGISPNPVPDTKTRFAADLYGDFRSELVIESENSDGSKEIIVIAAPDPIDQMFVSPYEDLTYKLWLSRNMGGGYGSVPNYTLKKPGAVKSHNE